ncbi:hypothetical protein [Streptosporangium saharense]|uniref:Uncharacterized protein n=1 Tax=Streptosporangium saharense TaxID=1706840 RepID=A0A7W7VMB8_9ACTN|nr:hypothetical protein [Streptosporangium saharense]MBB4915552.1 hypothetical protein [Streptosporangium saharense]
MSHLDQATWQRLCGPYDPARSYRAHVPDDLTQLPDARDCARCGRRIVPVDSAFGRLWVTSGADSTCPRATDRLHRPDTD